MALEDTIMVIMIRTQLTQAILAVIDVHWITVVSVGQYVYVSASNDQYNVHQMIMINSRK